ncbi:MAG TPA: twin-arginine translocase subunit TatC [Propionibacteriaceae bacterium]|nr:twin-arginine translocase subunit TatC [Micropruina sp.]HBX82021.1 twin-arginine translocase subunit TatC [Propionibacteriaceae bacterium]HBY24192.1 twin-arginine translocase subunit TatC [Propionibacteriaceae bacterium]
MSLADHLREFRYRVIISTLAIVLTAVIAAFFYNAIYGLLMQPWLKALELLKETNPSLDPKAVISGVAAPFTLIMMIAGVTGLIVSSPIWIYQAWAFIVPALHAHERKWAIRFVAVAVPLFLLGVAIGYIVLPTGISAMLALTPSTGGTITNLLDVNAFLDMQLRLMVIFGLAFELPVFLIGLNMAGIVKARQLAKVRTYVIFGLFVFAAAVTPSPDPFSMLALALPLVALFIAAEVVCRIHDRRALKADAEAQA